MNTKIKIKPKDKEELIEIIKKECKEKGWECDLNFIDTSLITDMSYLLNKETKLENFNGNISEWDVSNVWNMREMFYASVFNKDISKWDVSKVKIMSGMFFSSKFNNNINNWNTANVTDMSYMFYDSKFNKDIGEWNVSNVTEMYRMFCASVFNKDISKWDVSKVKDMSNMFHGSIFNRNISKWDVSKVENMEYMFKCSKIKKIPCWDYFKVNKIEEIFDDCNKLKKELPKWYQFNHIKIGEERKKIYEAYLKKERFSNTINNKLVIKNTKANKI
jgi:surface protein